MMIKSSVVLKGFYVQVEQLSTEQGKEDDQA